MMKGLIAGVTALAMMTAPLQAQEFDDVDFTRLVAALLAAGVLSELLKDDDADERHETDYAETQTYRQLEAPVVRRSERHNSWEPPVVRHRGQADQPRPLGGRFDYDVGGLKDRARDLPGDCLRTVDTRYGTSRLYVARCLERSHIRVNDLPYRCAVRVMTKRGPREGYDPYCLRESGYSIRRD